MTKPVYDDQLLLGQEGRVGKGLRMSEKTAEVREMDHYELDDYDEAQIVAIAEWLAPIFAANNWRYSIKRDVLIVPDAAALADNMRSLARGCRIDADGEKWFVSSGRLTAELSDEREDASPRVHFILELSPANDQGDSDAP